MKTNLLKLIMMFVMITSYSEGTFAQEKLVNRLTSTTEKSSQKIIPFKVETDFISGKSGCYLLNARVYLISVESGQKTLVVNDNVQVGDCEMNKKINTSNPNACEAGRLPNGDYVFPNQTTNKYCLLDVLLENKEVYNQYLKSVEKTLENR